MVLLEKVPFESELPFFPRHKSTTGECDLSAHPQQLRATRRSDGDRAGRSTAVCISARVIHQEQAWESGTHGRSGWSPLSRGRDGEVHRVTSAIGRFRASTVPHGNLSSAVLPVL